MSDVSRLHFLAYDAVGSALWSGLYVGLGYLFRRQFDMVGAYTSRIGSTLAFLLLSVFALYAGRQCFVLARMMLQLRLARIGPERLKQRFDYHLQTFADEGSEIVAGVPGAVLIDPFRLRGHEKIQLRSGVDIVLYCSSPNEFTSARVAVALQCKGISGIIMQEFLSPERAREIFGIRLAPIAS